MQAYRSKGSRTFRILSLRMRCVFLSSSHHTCVVGFVELLSYKDLQLSNMLGTRSIFISCLKKKITSYREISTLSRTVSVFIYRFITKYYHVMETRENQSGPAILLICFIHYRTRKAILGHFWSFLSKKYIFFSPLFNYFLFRFLFL